MTPDDHDIEAARRRRLRVALGCLGDAVTPPATFDELDLVRPGPAVSRPRTSAVAGVLAAALALVGGLVVVDQVRTRDAESSTIAVIGGEQDPAPDALPSGDGSVPSGDGVVVDMKSACAPLPDPRRRPRTEDMSSAPAPEPSTQPQLVVVDGRGDVWLLDHDLRRDATLLGSGYTWARFGAHGAVYASRVTSKETIIDRLAPGPLAEILRLPYASVSDGSTEECTLNGYLPQFGVSGMYDDETLLLVHHYRPPPLELCPADSTSNRLSPSGSGPICTLEEMSVVEPWSLRERVDRWGVSGAAGLVPIVAAARNADTFVFGGSVRRPGEMNFDVGRERGVVGVSPLGSSVLVNDSEDLTFERLVEPPFAAPPSDQTRFERSVGPSLGRFPDLQGVAMTAGWTVVSTADGLTLIPRRGDVVALSPNPFDGVLSIDAIDPTVDAAGCNWSTAVRPTADRSGTLVTTVVTLTAVGEVCEPKDLADVVAIADTGEEDAVDLAAGEWPSAIPAAGEVSLTLSTARDPSVCAVADYRLVETVELRFAAGAPIRVDLEIPILTCGGLSAQLAR